MTGTGALFARPFGDLADNLAGHLAFQLPGWHWPLLNAPMLAWPAGANIALTDSNPLLSVIAKLLAGLLGHPLNLFGAWLTACLILQAVLAVYAMRGMHAPRPRDWNAPIAAAAIAICALLLPEYLFRTFNINLMGQFLLLWALGYAARQCAQDRPTRLAMPAVLLGITIFVHPYLFVFNAIILAAPAIGKIIQRHPDGRTSLRNCVIAAQLSILAYMAASATLGGGGPGFGLYSTNLLSAVWPQRSGLFGSALPILDVTGYQYEGVNYLGAGNLLLLACALASLIAVDPGRIRAIWQRFSGMAVALGCLVALAITPHVTLGRIDVLPIDIPVLDHLFGAVRSSGRAIWMVDYACLTGAVALLSSRLRMRVFLPLMVGVIALQWQDSAPWRADARAYFAGTAMVFPQLALPANVELLHVVPLCDDNPATDGYHLQALRAGIKLAEIRLAHPPPAAECARALAAGLHDRMRPGEARLFLPSIALQVQPPALGEGVICAPQRAGLLCHLPGQEK